MNIFIHIAAAFRTLFLNKLRSGLSMLGIIIGVGSVIVLVAIGQGAQASITSKVQSLGTNLITISPGSQSQSNVRVSSMGGGNTTKVFTQDHIALLKKEVSEISAIAPELSGRQQVIAGQNNTSTSVKGVTPDYEAVKNFHATYGQFITDSNISNTDKVAVIGATTATTLFGTEDPLGQDIIIADRIFTVVGVMETKGTSGMSNTDDVIFIPLSTAEKIVFSTIYLTNISVSITSEDVMTTAKSKIEQTLMQALNIATTADQNFTIQNQADMLETMSSITGILTAFLGGIAAISLLVGGIGVMNIMLVSVTERTREIGIRKALGAKRNDILLQFLTESLVMSILWGIIGVAMSYLIVLGVNATGITTAVITTWSVLLAFGFSAVVGVVFGLLPAMKAAKLKPIDALRFE